MVWEHSGVCSVCCCSAQIPGFLVGKAASVDQVKAESSLSLKIRLCSGHPGLPAVHPSGCALRAAGTAVSQEKILPRSSPCDGGGGPLCLGNQGAWVAGAVLSRAARQRGLVCTKGCKEEDPTALLSYTYLPFLFPGAQTSDRAWLVSQGGQERARAVGQKLLVFSVPQGVSLASVSGLLSIHANGAPRRPPLASRASGCVRSSL